MGIATERIDKLLSEIDAAKSELQNGGQVLAAQLLAMAALQIRLQIHEITDEEFKEFCALLQQQAPAEGASESSAESNTGDERCVILKPKFSGR